MIAWRVYSEAQGQEYTDIEDVGYYHKREDAERAAAEHAAEANSISQEHCATDGKFYLSTTLYEPSHNGGWHRNNHMGDREVIVIEEIKIR